MDTNIKTPWGEIGYITFKRTYARRLKEDDASSETEEFYQVIQRELNACEKQLNLFFTDEEKERYFETRMKLKWSVAGRFMWQLGTKTVDKLGLPSLQNCAGVVVDNPIRPFTWTMEMLMLGAGVGYNIQKEYVYQIPKLKKKIKIQRLDVADADYIVPDTREGWIKLLGKTLKAHFYSGEGFTYSTQLIRSKGAPIRGFGGLASGPEELCWGIDEIHKILNNRAGKKVQPIDCLDIMNIIGYVVVSGNVRRSAQLAIGDYDDLEYLKAKRWDLYKIPNWRSMSNNSVACSDTNNLPQEYWDTYTQGEAYGLINLELARKVGRTGETQYPDKDVIVFNPCIVGETLVAVADGRGHVSIKELTEKGEDVPVYCLDNKNKVVIRYMRSPRVTGIDQDIYEVKLDNGEILKTTGNHKFLLLNGNAVEAKDLVVGSSLRKLVRYKSSYKMNHNSPKTTADYWWIRSGRTKQEHRLIAEFEYGDLKDGVIHHKDFDSLNNCITNLQLMTKEDHDNLHKERMFGDKNPMRRKDVEWSRERKEEYSKNISNATRGEKNGMFSGLTNEELVKQVRVWMSSLDYFPSILDYLTEGKERGWPLQLSKWRNNHFNGLNGLLRGIGKEIGLIKENYRDLDPRKITNYTKLLKQGYDCDLIDGRIIYNKVCEYCDIDFKSALKGSSYCSINCSNKHTAHLRVEGVRTAHLKKKSSYKEKQVKTYTDLSHSLGREPLYKEWIEECSSRNLSYRVGVNSNFKSYSHLKEEASFYNCRVVSVTKIGKDTVYNGSVDEFHNYFIGGTVEQKTSSGKEKRYYFSTLNCAEQSLWNHESCCLSEIFLPNIENYQEFLDCLELSYRVNKHSLALHCSLKETESIVNSNMRMGIGVTGILQATQQQRDWLKDAYVWLREYDKEYSKKNNFPQSIKLTTVKPSGSLSLLAGVTPGVHPNPAGPYYIRRMRIASNSILVDVCRQHGYSIEVQKKIDGSNDQTTMVVSFPCKLPTQTPVAVNYTWREQLDMVKRMQAEWSDNSVSCSVYYKLEDIEEIKKYLKEHYQDNLKTVSFMLYHGHGFIQAPYEDITKEQYEEMIKNTRPITSVEIQEVDFVIDECEGGMCPVK